MNPSFRQNSFLFLICLTLLSVTTDAAETAAELLPPSTLIYLQIDDPSATIDSFLKHPYLENLKGLEPYQEFEKSPQYLQGMTVLRLVEFQLGMTWQKAIHALSAGGITLAFDPATEGFAILFKAESPEKLVTVRDKVVKMARDDAKRKGEPDPYKIEQYREIDVYITKDGGFLSHDDWLIVGNKSDLGKQLVDALLDGREDSFANNRIYQMLNDQYRNKTVAWGMVNLDPLREADDEGLQKLFAGKADDPAGEILLGGLLESFQTISHLSLALQAGTNGLKLGIQFPYDASNVSENREHFFGPKGTGTAAPIQTVPEMLFGLTAYRDLSQVWLRAGDLFNEKVNDGIAQADSNLSTFFSGKDFGEEILGALSPQVQLIAARQGYREDQPNPAIKIPGFALLADMKNPEVTSREFRRIYQSFIGFFNVVGAMEGNPQFELDFENFAEGELISATPIPLVGEEQQRDAKINFNFSPTVAFKKNQLIISSARDLAVKVLKAERTDHQPLPNGRLNTQMELNIPELQVALANNRSHLIAQNMLKEGHTREEATQQIGIFLEALKLFQQLRLELITYDETVDLNLELELSE